MALVLLGGVYVVERVGVRPAPPVAPVRTVEPAPDTPAQSPPVSGRNSDLAERQEMPGPGARGAGGGTAVASPKPRRGRDDEGRHERGGETPPDARQDVTGDGSSGEPTPGEPEDEPADGGARVGGDAHEAPDAEDDDELALRSDDAADQERDD